MVEFTQYHKATINEVMSRLSKQIDELNHVAEATPEEVVARYNNKGDPQVQVDGYEPAFKMGVIKGLSSTITAGYKELSRLVDNTEPVDIGEAQGSVCSHPGVFRGEFCHKCQTDVR